MKDPEDEPSTMADLAAWIPDPGDRIVLGPWLVTNGGFWSDGEGYDDPVQVCVTHRRFVPCRTKTGCVYSVDPADTEAVRRYQQGGEDGHQS